MKFTHYMAPVAPKRSIIMRIQKAILLETFRIAVGALVLSAVMNVVFFLLNMWSTGVLYGALIGSFAAVLNFFLLGITVQLIANGKEDVKRNKLKLQLSYSLRMLVILGVVAFFATRVYISPVSLVLPLFFPRLTIALLQILGFYKPDKNETLTEKEEKNEVQEGD